MYHMLSSRKGINLHLQEIKMDLSKGNEKAIGVFVSGSETKQLGGKEIISEVERMGQLQELKISLMSASTIGPGRGGTSYLTDFDETWPV